MARSRKHRAEEHVNNERWLLTYADLITLLMVFFVVMYSMSRADTTKIAKLQAAFQKAFRVEVLRGNDPTSRHGDDGAQVPGAMASSSAASFSSSTVSGPIVSSMEDMRVALAQVRPNEFARGVQIGPTADGMAISLSNGALFDSGKADLKPGGIPLLDVMAERLRRMSNEVRIEGHTDNIATSSAFYPSNWELSAARATTVARYLSERGGVAADRLAVAAYGENRPIGSNATRDGRARNRRVDVVVLSTVVDPRDSLRALTAGGESVQ